MATITYLLKHYAEQEGLSTDIAKEVSQEATTLFLKYCEQKREEGKPIGYSYDSLAKSAVLLAMRKKGIPIRNPKAAFHLLKSVGGEVPYSPIPYIEWICCKLELTKETREKAREIALQYKAKTHRRPAPRVIAASSTYIACLMTRQGKTQEEIAQIAQCSGMTIRNNYKDIADLLNIPLSSLVADY